MASLDRCWQASQLVTRAPPPPSPPPGLWPWRNPVDKALLFWGGGCWQEQRGRRLGPILASPIRRPPESGPCCTQDCLQDEGHVLGPGTAWRAVRDSSITKGVAFSSAGRSIEPPKMGGGVGKRAQLTGPLISCYNYYELWRQRRREVFWALKIILFFFFFHQIQGKR